MPRRIEKSQDGQWQWKTFGDNGENTATSETFTRKADAKRGYQNHADGVLKDLWKRNELIDALVRTGLLDKINNAL